MSQNSPKAKLIDAITAWNPLQDALDWSDAKFNDFAREIFRVQFAQNEPYRKFCQKRGIGPDDIASYRDIPAVPTDVFKHVRLTVAEEPVRVFRTSGTTLGARGEHRFGTLDVYQTALVGPFRRFCVPDVDTLRMLVVAPSGRDLQDSSLSYMLDELVGRFGDAESAYFVRPGEDGQLEMRFDELREALDKAQADGVPTMLLGTSFGFIEFFDSCEQRWQLAEGSRIMETGGFKGKTREVTRDELYEIFEHRLGISKRNGVSEYSMTELSSQAYSDNLFLDHLSAEKDGAGGDNVLQTPPWVRVELVDPLSFEPIETPGEQGLIRWYDLANTESVMAIQTSDLGVLVEGGGFRLLGRAPQAELRGCSLTIEEIVDASR
ncbi:hypothetical protein [Bradymonas sediminis]|uniref:Uncharacterized protein n=1 Tax=Bradymonas sediminis TaxID=1548548 RepID=A0A2Z4FPV5_9DELT|nr:hypothetical protein [Bradymonas sediminis]AWV90940.1 hypothetical protein DN745_17055 [Bradymonas sediminis]TDP75323.1 acyl-protein synthetase LuxE [Bradymonas sediminis]